MRDCIAFVERNNFIANLASLVKLFIKLLTDTRPRFVKSRPVSPGNYIATKLCGSWSYLSNNYTGRPKKTGTLFCMP